MSLGVRKRSSTDGIRQIHGLPSELAMAYRASGRPPFSMTYGMFAKLDMTCDMPGTRADAD